MAAETKLDNLEELIDLLKEGLEGVVPLKDVYKRKHGFDEVIIPGPIPPEKLRLYPNIKRALEEESKEEKLNARTM